MSKTCEIAYGRERRGVEYGLGSSDDGLTLYISVYVTIKSVLIFQNIF